MKDRKYWLETMLKIVSPVVKNLAVGSLREKIPAEFHQGEFDTISLEAFGRTVCGIAPWLELENLKGKERALQEKYRKLVRICIDMATNPNSPDFMNFSNGKQPLVDAAFLAHAVLRAPKQLYALLDKEVKENLIRALKVTREIEPYENNWVLFSSMIETALLSMGEEIDERRLTYGIEKFAKSWYIGDGVYADGERYHWDYYNSFVIQPMYIDVLRCLSLKDEKYKETLSEAIRRASRYAGILERMIMPDGTYPIIGRSVTYRFGAFQLLSQAALQGFLPKNLSAGQARSALTAVIKKCLKPKETFDKNGWLTAGVYGKQPELTEFYINVGSLYLCSTIFLVLGLSPETPFWSEKKCDWTNKQIWSGKSVGRDCAVD
ncbi:MAG: DUF2264 domain-containing protein [Clostridia bacterium]|nr:DUF2264 domain-containing protein [Clostridia bacterium]